MLSDGNVHAHIDHVVALIDGAARDGVERLRLHPLADGRDVEDPSFEGYVATVEAVLARHCSAGRDYRIASAGGRMFVTMDRYESDWSIVERGWRAHVHGDAESFASVGGALAALRARPTGTSDQHLPPFVIVAADGAPVGRVVDGDSFVFWNFRGDRAIEISRAFADGEDFDGFDRGRVPKVRYAGMMQYDGDLALPRRFLVAPPVIERTMGEFTAALGLRTLAVSETQKFGHVTYFWNGNRSGRLDDELETYVEVPSNPPPFNARPAMQAPAITDVVLAALAAADRPDIVRLNYPNGDMVGHTGDLAATRRAVEAVDAEIGRLVDAVTALGGVLIVTADHGNADDMWMRDGAGQPRRKDGVAVAKTSHSLAPVPLTIVDSRSPQPWHLRADLPEAGLSHVAATCFFLLGYEGPSDMLPPLVEAPR